MTNNDSENDMPGNERALRWIGDLDHPFYNDERNRFVWYEASAIAFQMFILANIALVGAMVWIGGAAGIPYALGVLGVNGVITIIVFSYAEKRYADYTPVKSDFLRGRGLFGMTLLLFMSTGFLRAILNSDAADGTASGFSGGFSEGASWGIASLPLTVPIGIAIGTLLKRRSANELDVEDDFDEF